MIRLAAPTFDAADRARIDEVLTSGMLVQGRFVEQFEALVAEYLGVHVIANSSGTAALHLALMALDLKPGDEVIVPAFTWPSTAHVIVHAGGRPVFVDIDPDTLNLDIAATARAITPATRALLPVHLFGVPAAMKPLLAMTQDANIAIIEDAACAIGTVCDTGTLAGTIGTIGCFSLHPRKIITTGEGGLCTTRDPALAERLRRLRNHGMTMTDDGLRFVDIGLNYRLTELGGALGVGQMTQLPFILESRRRLGHHYLQRLAAIPSIRVPNGMAEPGNTFQSLVVDLGNSTRRAAIMAALAQRQIPTTIGTHAVTDQPWYIEHLGVDPAAYPNAHAAWRGLMTLPLHQHMTTEEVDQVCDALAAVVDAEGA